MKNETKRAAPTAFILSFSSYLADDCVCLNPGHGRRKDLAFQRVPAEAGDSSLTPFGLFFFGGGGGEGSGSGAGWKKRGRGGGGGERSRSRSRSKKRGH